jgi:6-phospho-beta-glucosidase
MKIAILGGAGLRTPLIIRSMVKRQKELGLSELFLMDTDARQLELTGAITEELEKNSCLDFKIERTTDAKSALAGADYVIMTFRVGGMKSRVVDERVALSHGVLGQETTGPGGFAMAMRSIPVALEYVKLMKEVCPDAWLINFSNPSGIVTEAIINKGGWKRTIGICDAPEMIRGYAAIALGAKMSDVQMEYFGLNHLGWARAIWYKGKNHVPDFIKLIKEAGGLPGLPFSTGVIESLGMIPNEYLYYFYHSKEAVDNILKAGKTRGEMLVEQNAILSSDLDKLYRTGDREGLAKRYKAYIDMRGETYMANETGGRFEEFKLDQESIDNLTEEGYADVALGAIEALSGGNPRVMTLNVPNAGAIYGFPETAIVEIPVLVGTDSIRQITVGNIPLVCMGLMQSVKSYELYTVEAATEGSYMKAVAALTVHPLVRDYALAKSLVDGYVKSHGDLFPRLD